MPSYTVPINGPNGPGFMTVNANNAAEAANNASQGGNIATGQAQEGGHQAHTGTGGTAVAGYPAGYGPGGQIVPGGPATGGPATTTTATNPNPTSQQLSDGIQKMWEAIASGNKDILNEQIREFDKTFGLNLQQFTENVRQFNENLQIAQANLTGTYQGQPTMPALQAYATQFGTWGVPTPGEQTLAAQAQWANLYGQNAPPAPGQQTLAAQQQAYAQQLGAIQTAAGLQANPFRQQQVLGQLGPLLTGVGGVAGFQAPNTVAGVGTAGGTGPNTGLAYMQQMIDDIKNPGANQASVQGVLDAIPTPNKINSADFLRSAPSTQQMILQGMQEKFGLDPNDSLAQIKNTLPAFQAPTTFGTIKG